MVFNDFKDIFVDLIKENSNIINYKIEDENIEIILENKIRKIYRLNRIYKSYINKVENKSIEEVKVILGLFLNYDNLKIIDLNNLKEYIYPVLTTDKYNNIIQQNYNEHLYIYFIVDLDLSIYFINEDILFKSDFNYKKLEMYSYNNLRRDIIKIKEVDENIFALHGNKIWNSSIIILPDIINTLTKEINKDLYMCICNEYTVLLFSKDNINIIRQYLLYHYNLDNKFKDINIYAFIKNKWESI